jgi:hypothetical protein
MSIAPDDRVSIDTRLTLDFKRRVLSFQANMQMHLREISRERYEEVVVEADHCDFRILLLLAGSCWLIGSVSIQALTKAASG